MQSFNFKSNLKQQKTYKPESRKGMEMTFYFDVDWIGMISPFNINEMEGLEWFIALIVQIKKMNRDCMFSVHCS